MSLYTALTLDLDDTLWPIAPVMEAAERALDAHLHALDPALADAWPIPRIRALRDQVWRERTDLAHDYTTQRIVTLRQILLPAGHDEAAVQRAFEVFYAARNAVTLYPDAREALDRLAARYPLVAISNGNACLSRTGLEGYFVGSWSARDHGRPKPSPCIFHAAAERFRLHPAETLHVGDDLHHDVAGALAAGLGAAWLNRRGESAPADPVPTLTVTTLAELADRLC